MNRRLFPSEYVLSEENNVLPPRLRYFERLKVKANSMMTNTFYKGETIHFNFNKYIDTHLKAHWLYDQAESGALTEPVKILRFNSGIRSEAGLELIIESASGLPDINSSFKAYSDFILKGVNGKKRRSEHISRSENNVIIIDSDDDDEENNDSDDDDEENNENDIDSDDDCSLLTQPEENMEWILFCFMLCTY